MSEKIKGVKQIGPNSFLFFKFPDSFFLLSFEIIEVMNFKIYLIKMQPTETYVYEATAPFSVFGTDIPSPQDSLKNICFLIYNNDFTINEEMNKMILNINTKNKASLDLFLYDVSKEPKKDSLQQRHINNLQNNIKNLLNIVSMQDQKINELRQREDGHKKLLNKIEQITSNISKQMEMENQNQNQNNNNSANNPYNRNNNQFNEDKFNIYKTNNNNNLRHTRTMTTTQNYPNYNNMLNNYGNNPNIKITTNTIYNPILPANMNVNNLLTRPENRPPPMVPKLEPKRTINLDKIENYRP